MSLIKLVIPRKLWGKGALLNKDGTMCCLGHASKACGVPESKMRIYSIQPDLDDCNFDVSVPLLSWEEEYGVPHWMIHYLTATTGREAAIAANDSNVMTDEQREAELIKIFKDHGIELSFEGEK